MHLWLASWTLLICFCLFPPKLCEVLLSSGWNACLMLLNGSSMCSMLGGMHIYCSLDDKTISQIPGKFCWWIGVLHFRLNYKLQVWLCLYTCLYFFLNFWFSIDFTPFILNPLFPSPHFYLCPCNLPPKNKTQFKIKTKKEKNLVEAVMWPVSHVVYL